MKANQVDGIWKVGQWSKIHGDRKSSKKGNDVIRARLQKGGDGSFQVEVFGSNNVVHRRLRYGKQPTFDQVGHDLKIGEGKL